MRCIGVEQVFRALVPVVLAMWLGGQVACARLQANISMITDGDPVPLATRVDAVVLGLLREGRDQEATVLAEYSLELRVAALGSDHIELTRSLDILATAYGRSHLDNKLEQTLIRARDVRIAALGPTHPDVGLAFGRLAEFFSQHGDERKTEAMLERALAIFDRGSRNEGHPAQAAILHTGGMHFLRQGNYATAEKAFRAAIIMYDRAPGAFHAGVADSVEGRALALQAQGAYAAAEPLFHRALAIRQNTLGLAHPRVALSLGNLGLHYQVRGDYARAESAFIRALEIQESALGAHHPAVAVSLHNLGRDYQLMGAHEAAVPLLARATEIHEESLRYAIARLSERGKRALMVGLQDETDSVMSLAADLPSSEQARELALTTVLRRKGRILDSLASNLKTLHDHATPETRTKLAELDRINDVRRKIRPSQLDPVTRAKLDALAKTEEFRDLFPAWTKDPSHSGLRTEMIDWARKLNDQTESELYSASAGSLALPETVTIAKIRSALPHDAVLIELVRYRHVTVRQRLHDGPQMRYAAYLLPSQGPVRAVELGDAAPIDACVDAVLAEMRNRTHLTEAQAALRHLDRLVLGPLRDHLTNISHIIVSPDSKLNLVPFEALIDPGGRYELEHRLVSYVTSGRDLIRPAMRLKARSTVMVLAAPAYGPESTARARGAVPFRPLAGALAEAGTLATYFPEAGFLVGKSATKSAFGALRGPGVLHVATHGFYTRQRTKPTSASRSVGPDMVSFALPASSVSPDTRGLYVEDDLFTSYSGSEDIMDALDRAGLALASANTGAEGIVTAGEIARYDWWGTQLVVLSACETGVGALPSADGVHGLRRALALAGAESQIVSLWQISDAVTPQLMDAFYSELAQGTGRGEALRNAKLRLLRQPAFAHPYYWAAFILAGDWTPLDTNLLLRSQHAN